MAVRDDFVVLILTHGRPDTVHTYKYLRDAGYTGPIVLVVDDEDKTVDQYRERYGDQVYVFSKSDAAAAFDEGDNNVGERRTIFYARNASFGIVAKLGYRYFIQLDDDYTSFFYRWSSARVYGQWRVRTTMDECLMAMLDYYIQSGATSIAMSQGGDHIGGGGGERGRDIKGLRKCMNSFICSIDRPFSFFGKFNEDVNTYVLRGRRGELFLTIVQIQLNQLATQSNPGGITEAYLGSGTYVKSFFTVMYAPSCARISEISDPRSPRPRIHHRIEWPNAAPMILHEKHRKQDPHQD